MSSGRAKRLRDLPIARRWSAAQRVRPARLFVGTDWAACQPAEIERIRILPVACDNSPLMLTESVVVIDSSGCLPWFGRFVSLGECGDRVFAVVARLAGLRRRLLRPGSVCAEARRRSDGRGGCRRPNSASTSSYEELAVESRQLAARSQRAARRSSSWSARPWCTSRPRRQRSRQRATAAAASRRGRLGLHRQASTTSSTCSPTGT